MFSYSCQDEHTQLKYQSEVQLVTRGLLFTLITCVVFPGIRRIRDWLVSFCRPDMNSHFSRPANHVTAVWCPLAPPSYRTSLWSFQGHFLRLSWGVTELQLLDSRSKLDLGVSVCVCVVLPPVSLSDAEQATAHTCILMFCIFVDFPLRFYFSRYVDDTVLIQYCAVSCLWGVRSRCAERGCCSWMWLWWFFLFSIALFKGVFSCHLHTRSSLQWLREDAHWVFVNKKQLACHTTSVSLCLTCLLWLPLFTLYNLNIITFWKHFNIKIVSYMQSDQMFFNVGMSSLKKNHTP